jgi:hypothetical protein
MELPKHCTCLQWIWYCFDSSGNVFVANTFSHRIEKFTTGGTLITQWGTRGSADGQFDSPHDIAIDSSNNIFVSDTEFDSIYFSQ